MVIGIYLGSEGKGFPKWCSKHKSQIREKCCLSSNPEWFNIPKTGCISVQRLEGFGESQHISLTQGYLFIA